MNEVKRAEQGQHLNQVSLSFLSRSENVALARLIVAAIAAEHDMTVAELDEIKVAVSEAVSNAIIHGYGNAPEQTVEMNITVSAAAIKIAICDRGVGIADIEQAVKPNFSSDSERMGLGFAFMHSFMDRVEVASILGEGTTVTLTKNLS